MSTTETTSTGGDAPSTTEKVQYQPHRAWYRRVDVLVPIALIALGYLFLIVVCVFVVFPTNKRSR